MARPLPFRNTDPFIHKGIYDKLHYATTTIDSSHRAVHEGFVFYVEKYRDPFPANTTELSLLRTGSKAPHLQTFSWKLDYDIKDKADGRVIIRLYEDAVVTSNGIEGQPINRNRAIDIENVPTLRFFSAPTVSNLGTVITTLMMPSSGGSEDLTGGGADEWVLKPNTNYVAEVINQSPEPCRLLTRLSWYEISFEPPVQGF